MKLMNFPARTLAGTLGLMVSVSAHASFLPENSLWVFDNPEAPSNITEEQFNQTIDAIAAVYEPIVKSHGATLVVKKNWSSSTVNASAEQRFGSWILNFYGGLARRPEISVDGFAMVACHELGHHLAGFPFTSSWAANEGQADYFATQVCARRLWAEDHAKNTEARELVPETAKKVCDAVWTTEAEQNLCYRVALSGQSLGTLLASLQNKPAPSFDTPDTTVVVKTNNRHPVAQCRLDTYFAGAICSAAFNDFKIPGKGHPAGQGSADAEEEAAEFSCTKVTHELGLRPTCWFKSRI